MLLLMGVWLVGQSSKTLKKIWAQNPSGGVNPTSYMYFDDRLMWVLRMMQTNYCRTAKRQHKYCGGDPNMLPPPSR